jgi:hypothetical protein
MLYANKIQLEVNRERSHASWAEGKNTFRSACKASSIEDWRKHVVESVKKNTDYGCYSRVEREEQEDGIHIHRASVRYWKIKDSDPLFHNGAAGGARNSCFQKWEISAVKSYIIYFFRKDRYATQVDLAEELSRVFNRTVTVRV